MTDMIFWAEPIGPVSGVSYSPFRRGQSPFSERYPSPEQIDADLDLLRPSVSRIRVYGSTGVLGHIIPSAAARGLNVTAGAWLDKDLPKNERELEALVRLAHQHDNIQAAVVGNEAVLRGDLSAKQLIFYLRRAQKALDVPVSTAETWKVWLEHPELAEHVDFITVHILPYWEGVPVEHATEYLFRRLREVKAAFPNKRVVLGEVGWPSAGQSYEAAIPGRHNQQYFLTRFVARARAEALDFFVIEAFDQPWKASEGSVGGAWGLFDVDRHPKLNLRSAPRLLFLNDLLFPCLMSTVLATIFTLLVAFRMTLLRSIGAAVLSLSAAFGISWMVHLVRVPGNVAMNPATSWLWPVMLVSLALLFVVTGTNIFELAELLWRRRWIRRFTGRNEDLGEFPMVSIHIPVCNEPPEMVIRSLRSIAALEYPEYEVLVISNNTANSERWLPLKDECHRLGARFRFCHLEQHPGYKAGAMNFALRHTHPSAQIIAVVDSDYLVDADWLRSLVPHFSRDERLGFVQAPQDYRDWNHSCFQRMCNWEYQGFFRLGMVIRNERDAIIQHGTMVLIRRAAIEEVDGWAEWCICEDTELGLRLMRSHYTSVYIPESHGRGVVPPTFASYKSQRARWAYGAARILRHHWRSIASFRRDGLTLAQRYHFVAGWLPWLSDALHVIFTLVMLAWTAGMLVRPQVFAMPYWPVVAPVLVISILNMLRSFWLYSRRVPCGVADRMGAMVAGLSLVYTVGTSVLRGMVTSNRSFGRTEKDDGTPSAMAPVLPEATLLLLLCVALALVAAQDTWSRGGRLAWSLLLAIQAVPYAAAVGFAITSAVCQKMMFQAADEYLSRESKLRRRVHGSRRSEAPKSDS